MATRKLSYTTRWERWRSRWSNKWTSIREEEVDIRRRISTSVGTTKSQRQPRKMRKKWASTSARMGHQDSKMIRRRNKVMLLLFDKSWRSKRKKRRTWGKLSISRKRRKGSNSSKIVRVIKSEIVKTVEEVGDNTIVIKHSNMIETISQEETLITRIMVISTTSRPEEEEATEVAETQTWPTPTENTTRMRKQPIILRVTTITIGLQDKSIEPKNNIMIKKVQANITLITNNTDKRALVAIKAAIITKVDTANLVATSEAEETQEMITAEMATSSSSIISINKKTRSIIKRLTLRNPKLLSQLLMVAKQVKCSLSTKKKL